MKTFKSIFLIITILSSKIVFAQNDSSKPINLNPPKIVEGEGTAYELKKEDVEDLLIWAQNAKKNLEQVLKDAEKLTGIQRRTYLQERILKEIEKSGIKESELLMRIVLLRSLKVDRELGTPTSGGELIIATDWLESSIRLAIEFYLHDLEYLNIKLANTQNAESTETKVLDIPMSQFGIRYSQFIFNYMVQFTNSRTQYTTAYWTLGWLGKDLESDRNKWRNQFASPITDIYAYQEREREKQNLPGGVRDDRLLSATREMKTIFRDQIKPVIEDIQKKVSIQKP